MMGIAERAGVWRMWRQSSKPSVPGNITSSRNSTGISRTASVSTEAPLTKLCTSNPAACRLWEMRRGVVSRVFFLKTKEGSPPPPRATPLHTPAAPPPPPPRRESGGGGGGALRPILRKKKGEESHRAPHL